MKNLNHIKDIKSLIALAIKDNKQLIKKIDNGEKFIRNMDYWHVKEGEYCVMCMAGAVMKGSLNLSDATDISIYSGPKSKIKNKRDLKLIELIDHIRGLVSEYDIGFIEDFDMLNYDEVREGLGYEPDDSFVYDIDNGDIKAWETLYNMLHLTKNRIRS